MCVYTQIDAIRSKYKKNYFSITYRFRVVGIPTIPDLLHRVACASNVAYASKLVRIA